ncbi:MAG TPA: 5'-nucleotidase C-terminal domain-containing protein [Gemmatimonadales bacterium]|nr:5'-nucleotidase C-terminal domain-containing protein [Gemmatimonadales bacterium]
MPSRSPLADSLRRLVRALGLAPLVATASLVAQDSARIVVVATTDVHGRVMHWDYETDRAAPWGLTRAATALDSLRRLYPNQVVLLDAGDLIQGNPFAAFFATVEPVDPHPVVDALNGLGYDAAVLGNHEFNFGVDVLTRAMAGATYTVVAGNVFGLPRDTLMYQRAVVFERNGVRVGVTGFTTPGVMVWDRANVRGRVRVRPIMSEVAPSMARLSEGGAELKIALLHSGLDGPSSYDTTGVGEENVAWRLAVEPDRPHLVVVGHTHRRMVDSVINGVHFIQPEPWARSLAVAHVSLVRENTPRAGPGPWRVTRIRGEQIPLAQVPPHPGLVRRLDQAHERVRVWAGAALGTVDEEWSARYARAEDTPIIDFVNEVQRRVSGAQLSATAAFNTQAGFAPGAIRLRDVAALYPYENTLKVVRIDGATLTRYLEKTAAYYHRYPGDGRIVDETIPGYNFDIVAGVSYAIDLTRPVGSRIVQLTYQGRLVEATDTFTLALNNYRQGGGGGYDMLAGLPVVYDSDVSIRDLLADWIRRAEVLRRTDYFTDSWRIIPPEAAARARGAFEPRR